MRLVSQFENLKNLIPRWARYAALSLTLVLGFQNCGQNHAASTASRSISSSDALGITTPTNLVLTSSTGPTQLSAGACKVFNGGMSLCMQASGQLVVKDVNGTAVWATSSLKNYNIPGYSGDTTDLVNCTTCFAAFQADGNLVLYNSANKPYWSSSTDGTTGGVLQISQTSPYISINNSSGTTVWAARATAPFSYPVTLDACNGVSFDQVPAASGVNPNNQLFIGRDMISGLGSCDDSKGWRLTVSSMNWETHKLSTINANLFLPPQTIVGGYVITTAYDVSLLYAYGEIWAAFECSDWNTLGAVSCMGPVTTNGDTTGASWRIDPTRTTVVVKNNCASGVCHSASVPKLFFWHGLPYMYYTAVHMAESDGKWSGASTRGIALRNTKGVAGGLFWELASSAPTPAVATNGSEVFKTNSTDPLSDQYADSFAVYTDGPAGEETSLYLTGGVGGTIDTGCIPGNAGFDYTVRGCYRQSLSKATTPLGDGIFNAQRVPESDSHMPSNANQYLRRFFDNKGHSMFWAAYYPGAKGAPHIWQGARNSMWVYPADPAALNYLPTQLSYTAGSFNMSPGQTIQFAGGSFTYQKDGNLVLYNAYNIALWGSPIFNSAPFYCDNHKCLSSFQADGNLVQYIDTKSYWASGTSGHTDARLLISIKPGWPHVSIVNSSSQFLLTN